MTVELASLVRDVPDHPVPGVSFKDVTPLLRDSAALAESVRLLSVWARRLEPNIVVGAEARGFVVGAALAVELGCGFVPARRPGKLPPGGAVRRQYTLEYGSNELELPLGTIEPGSRALIHDDVLALGGTAHAIAEMVSELGAETVGFCFLVELTFLGGRSRLSAPVRSLISY